jgi:hypothetical protein
MNFIIEVSDKVMSVAVLTCIVYLFATGKIMSKSTVDMIVDKSVKKTWRKMNGD